MFFNFILAFFVWLCMPNPIFYDAPETLDDIMPPFSQQLEQKYSLNKNDMY